MIRKINLKLILLSQLKRILSELFRILRGGYQPTQLYLRPGFSSPAQASSSLICVEDDSAGAAYRPRVRPSPVVLFD